MIGELYQFKIVLRKKYFLLALVLLPNIEVIQYLLNYLPFISSKTITQLLFLSGCSHGHLAQILVLWLMPVYYQFLLGDDFYVNEKYGYKYALMSRIKPKEYLHLKLLLAFISGFFIMMLSLILNMLVVTVLFSSVCRFSNQESLLSEYLIYMIVASLMSGSCALMTTCISYFFVYPKYTYSISMLIWFTLIYDRISLMYIFQPYDEYSIVYCLPVILIYVGVIMLLITGVLFYENKRSFH